MKKKGGNTVKKFIILVLTIGITLSLALSPVYAAETEYEKVVSEVDKTNTEIDKMISKAVEKTDKAMEKDIYELTSRLEPRIEKIIDELINDTNKKAAKMIEKAADKGFVVVCEMVEVEIGGQVILIDPLRIIGF